MRIIAKLHTYETGIRTTTLCFKSVTLYILYKADPLNINSKIYFFKF